MTAAPDLSKDAEPVLLTVGRMNLDLYSEQVGVPISQASTFRAEVGGSPTNIAIAARRLGTPAAVLTAAGTDPAGDLVSAQLAATGVDTRWVRRLTTGATSMALLATLAPDEGQRQFYRSNPADIHLELSTVGTLPWDSLKVVLLSADALARGSTATVLPDVAVEAVHRRVPVWWDLDLRESTWADLSQYAKAVRPVLSSASVVLGTETEYAAILDTPYAAVHQVVRDLQLPTAIVKTGARGAVLYSHGMEPVAVPAVSASPVCTVGGGDALAGGLIHALLRGESWPDALAFAMRVAGWTVTQPGCSHGFPTLEQLDNATAQPVS